MMRPSGVPASPWPRRLRHAFDLYGLLERLYGFFIRTQFQRCGKGFRIRFGAVVRGPENIVLGDNFNALGPVYLYANDGGYLQVGDNCSVNTNVQLGAAGGKIIIGDNVLIAPNVVMRAANHGIGRAVPIRLQPHVYGEIVVEDDVWIGSNAVITSGVTLSVGTVVGAGAVVTRSTEPYSIVGGVPARKMGERSE